MLLPLLSTFACFLAAHCHRPTIFASPNDYEANAHLNTLQLIRKYDYPAEGHIAKSADGYLVELHRIPHGKNTSAPKRGPVFLQHGLLTSSFDSVLTGPDNAIAFLLADAGFDVWMGNVRGNVYSRAHVSLSPSNNKFWDFSWHESSLDELPAQLDYVCNFTKRKKIPYVGFSMGTTMFFVLASTRPEYNDKIAGAFLMAPIAYLKHVRSPLFRFLSVFADIIKFFDELFIHGEFLPQSKLFNLFSVFCQATYLDQHLCMNFIFSITGKNPEQFDKKILRPLISHFPSGYSVKGANHYAQLMKSGKFRQYDYGRFRNKIRYGSPAPPEYHLESIRVPVYLYVGNNDPLSTMEDVDSLVRRLKTVQDIFLVPHPDFSHLDFVTSTLVRSLVNEPVMKDLIAFLKTNSTRLSI